MNRFVAKEKTLQSSDKVDGKYVHSVVAGGEHELCTHT